MEKIIAATKNKGKIREINAITEKLGISVIPRDEAGVPEDFDTDETGSTFEENSEMKARDILEMTGIAAVADDSGLVVDVLAAVSGVLSQEENRKKILEKLSGVPDEARTARFVCVVTLAMPGGETLQARGTVEGKIIEEERGENGFGYDPIFIPDGYDRTFAQMSAEEKNGISHRANALAALAELLEKRG